MPRTLTSLLLFLAVLAQGTTTQSSNTPKPEQLVRYISFPTDDHGVIYANLYGEGDRGVVLAHGGSFNKESWQPQAHYLAKAGFLVLAFDFRGYGQSHGPGDSDLYTAPLKLDVLAAVRYLRGAGAKTVAVIGGSLGGGAAADAVVAAKPDEINRLVLLAATPDSPADKISVPLLVIVAQDDADEVGPRLPRIRRWFEKAPQPKKLLVVNGSAHAQFLFQTDQGDRVMTEIQQFLSSPSK
jgi:pimeloyl-ACP methyl ester carboxylesterase